MTPDDAALALSCWVCGGPLRAKGKPWRFWCDACEITTRPDDIGGLQRAIVRRAMLPTAEKVTSDG
jgi:tRNA(Ile2) C34 agmatinyltransferase TiaS